MSLSNYLEDKFANTLRGGGNGVSYTAPGTVYAKLATGDPGEDGTSNAAGETTRQAVEFGAASGGAIALSNTPSWTNVSTSETYAYLSLWDHVSAGNCLGSGALTSPKTVAAGDTFTLSSLTITIS